MEATSGQILSSHNRDERIPPASFVKLMTLYVVFDMMRNGKLTLTDEVYISKKAWQTGGSKMFIEVGSRVPVEELIKGIAVVSGNDACVALAEHLYGSTEAFVQMLNTTAKKLGMTNSHFENPHGLPHPNQYTTAYDMALLAQHYIHDFPDAIRFHAMQEYTYLGIRQFNRNRLLRRDPSVDGLKTGYIKASGYHLLATAEREGYRLLVVVMGTVSPAVREEEALKLLNYGYRSFTFMALFAKDEALYNIPVLKGTADTLAVVPSAAGAIVLPEAYSKKVVQEKHLPEHVEAPIAQGQVIGKYLVKLDDKVLKSIPLVAEVAVPRAGFLKVMQHNVYLLVKGRGLLFALVGVLILAVVVTSMSVLSKRRKRRRRRLQIRL